MTSIIKNAFFRYRSGAFILHSDLKRRLGAQRHTRKDVHKLVNNQCTAVGVLLDNVGQTCGVHTSDADWIPHRPDMRPGWVVFHLKQPLDCLQAARVLENSASVWRNLPICSSQRESYLFSKVKEHTGNLLYRLMFSQQELSRFLFGCQFNSARSLLKMLKMWFTLTELLTK